jgi:hypothetical protein
MSSLKIEGIRFSSSSIDEFFKPTPRVASFGRVRISSLGQLAGFEFVADDQLIRVSKQDFWRLGQDAEGHYIERLVDDGLVPEEVA